MNIIGFDLISLKQVSKPVQVLGGSGQRRVVDKLLRAARSITIDWYGLSAPQIGEFQRVFVLRDVENKVLIVCVNPEVIEASTELVNMPEYCMSVPVLGVNIVRPVSVKVKYYTPKGEEVTREFSGMLGRAFQHELDHLNGILITDYLIVKDEHQTTVESGSA